MVRRAHHKLKIYTKTGDKGETSLFGGKRVSKADLRVEVIGEIDELNSVIGIAVANIKSTTGTKGITSTTGRIKDELVQIQQDLLEIGSILASPTKRHTLNAIPLNERTRELEKTIDELAKELPELRNFILPGGGEVGSFLHLARSVCRRAERRIVKLSKKEKVDEPILIYLNRLSDLLFTMARFVNLKENKKEVIWER